MMKPLIKLTLSVGIALTLGSAAAQTTYTPGVVTFDSLPNSAGGVHLPAAYDGFNWGTDLYSMTRTGTGDDYVAFTSGGGRSIFRTDTQGFYFDSADFFLRPGADTNDFSFVLYGKNAAGSLVSVYNGLTEKFGRNHLTYDPAAPGKLVSFEAITEGVDGKANGAYSGLIYGVAIAFDNTGYTDFGMDNFRFRAATSAPITTPVPEPESYAMMLLGLTLMGAVVRRRRASV